MCPAIILILSPLGTQTRIEEQDSEREVGLMYQPHNGSIWSQNIKQKLGVSFFLDLIRP